MDAVVRHVALNTKFGPQSGEKMLAVALSNHAIHLWNITDGNASVKTGSLAFFDFYSYH